MVNDFYLQFLNKIENRKFEKTEEDQGLNKKKVKK